jgi:hypothetical protein
MREKSYAPEDLPPLELRSLRRLHVRGDGGEQRDLLAASGVVRRGDFAYVIADDELDLAVFRISRDEPGELRTVLRRSGEAAKTKPGVVEPAYLRRSGEALPEDPAERKAAKPDLEALTALPPMPGAPYGGLLGLGSGSDADGKRDRGFFWALAADGSLEGEPRTLDLGPLYRMLRDELGGLNVEGAAILGDRLWLFHRGNESQAGNVVAELSLSDLSGSLAGDLDLDVSELRELRAYELGEMDGVPLCFSDATALSDELICFTASAEGADDGDVRGSVVGTISDDGEVHRLRTIDRRWKVEGVHAAVDTGVIDFVFVCDQDSDDEPSPLLTATMPLDPEAERSAHV